MSRLAPRLGRLVMRFGERHTIMLENTVLIVVFAGYATTMSAAVAGLLFILDGVFFTLTLAQRRRSTDKQTKPFLIWSWRSE